MNLIEAVKELKENPLAECIQFAGQHGITRRIEIENKAYPGGSIERLVFPETPTQKKQVVMASWTDFLLREDFDVVYRRHPKRELSTKEIKQKVQELLDELERRSR